MGSAARLCIGDSWSPKSWTIRKETRSGSVSTRSEYGVTRMVSESIRLRACSEFIVTGSVFMSMSAAVLAR